MLSRQLLVSCATFCTDPASETCSNCCRHGGSAGIIIPNETNWNCWLKDFVDCNAHECPIADCCNGEWNRTCWDVSSAASHNLACNLRRWTAAEDSSTGVPTTSACNPRMPGCFTLHLYQSGDGTCTGSSQILGRAVTADAGCSGTFGEFGGQMSCNNDGTVTLAGCDAETQAAGFTLRPSFAGSCGTAARGSQTIDILVRGICPLNAVREPVSSGSSRLVIVSVVLACCVAVIVIGSSLILYLTSDEANEASGAGKYTLEF